MKMAKHTCALLYASHNHTTRSSHNQRVNLKKRVQKSTLIKSAPHVHTHCPTNPTRCFAQLHSSCATPLCPGARGGGGLQPDAAARPLDQTRGMRIRFHGPFPRGCVMDPSPEVVSWTPFSRLCHTPSYDTTSKNMIKIMTQPHHTTS